MNSKNQKFSFSQRLGLEPKQPVLLVNTISDELRQEFFNIFYSKIFQARIISIDDQRAYDSTILHIWRKYFKKSYEDIPGYDRFKNHVKNYIMSVEWNKVYEFMEFITAIIINNPWVHPNFEIELNEILFECGSGYRMTKGVFIPITNSVELSQISEFEKSLVDFSFPEIETHLKTAIKYLSEKPKPDSRNSIKESISMVETISRLMTGESTLGKALKHLDKKQMTSPMLNTAFTHLYSFTNGPEGIRHSLLNEPGDLEEEAKFFLVACSSFTNYLIAKGHKKDMI